MGCRFAGGEGAGRIIHNNDSNISPFRNIYIYIYMVKQKFYPTENGRFGGGQMFLSSNMIFLDFEYIFVFSSKSPIVW